MTNKLGINIILINYLIAKCIANYCISLQIWVPSNYRYKESFIYIDASNESAIEGVLDRFIYN